MKTTKRSVLYEVPKFRVRCISGHKCDLGGPASFAKSNIIGVENKRTNYKTLLLGIKNNGTAGYQGSMKIVLKKTSAGLLN